MCVRMCICVFVLYECTCVYVCMYVCMSLNIFKVCMYLCVYVSYDSAHAGVYRLIVHKVFWFIC